MNMPVNVKVGLGYLAGIIEGIVVNGMGFFAGTIVGGFLLVLILLLPTKTDPEADIPILEAERLEKIMNRPIK